MLKPCALCVATAQLRAHLPQEACATLAKMRSAGLKTSNGLFNKLLESMTNCYARDSLAIVEEMAACGLKPYSETCSILLAYAEKPGGGVADRKRV